MVFVTTTDGNHGRGVAWAARKLGCEAHVYLPAAPPLPGRRPFWTQARWRHGFCLWAMTTRCAMRPNRPRRRGGLLSRTPAGPAMRRFPLGLSRDTPPWPGKRRTNWPEAGVDRPTHVFLQAGVGAMAGGVLGYLADRYGAQAPVLPWWSRRTSQASMPLPKPVTVSPIRPRARGRPSWRALTVQSPVP